MSIQITEKLVKFYLGAYLLVSLLFSSVVFLKLKFAFNTGLIGIVLYDMYYYVMPSITILILFVFLLGHKPEFNKLSKWQNYAVVVVSIFFIVVVSWCLLHIDYELARAHTPLSYTLFPLIPVFVICLHFKKRAPEGRLLSKKMAASFLAIVILMPYALVFLGFNSALSVGGAVQSETERIEFVLDYVGNVTASFWGLKGCEKRYVILHRARSDFLKFLMVGAGSCGEMAHATKTFFDNLDVESRIVKFPGEDHMFVEVKLNGMWMVADPGSSPRIMTREERSSSRLGALGGLSYVVAYTDQGLIELTHHYVTTDRIVIRVTENDEPVANARIVLKHTFMGNKMSLPELHSDVNGTVEMNLGPLTYNNSNIEPAEPYYWIYVNGQNTEFKATSIGSGRSVYIEIDLSDALEGQ